MRWTIPTTLMIGLLFLYSCNKGVEPEEINYHNKILFASSRSGKEQLYMMNPDGTGIRQLTTGRWWHSHGRWSPDAKQIVCNTEEYTTTAGISMVVMNVDGTNRRYLGWGGYMSWSPDGKKIAFSHSPYAELGYRGSYIYVVNADGTNRVQLTANLGVLDDTPSWSPDGSTIAFSSDRDYPTGPLRSEIYLMNPDGSNQRRLTFTDSLINITPSWSPDGSMIAFQSNGEIALINMDGTNYRKITTRSASRGFVLLEPRWSPDGKQLVAWSYSTDGLVRRYLYTVNMDGSGLRRLLEDSTATSPDWLR